MSFSSALFASNAIGFGLFGGDDPRKANILNVIFFFPLRYVEPI